MTLTEVIDYFGCLNKACLALDIRPQNMTYWRRKNYVPYKQQFRIAELTNWKLKPDASDPHVFHKRVP